MCNGQLANVLDEQVLRECKNLLNRAKETDTKNVLEWKIIKFNSLCYKKENNNDSCSTI